MPLLEKESRVGIYSAFCSAMAHRLVITAVIGASIATVLGAPIFALAETVVAARDGRNATAVAVAIKQSES